MSLTKLLNSIFITDLSHIILEYLQFSGCLEYTLKKKKEGNQVGDSQLEDEIYYSSIYFMTVLPNGNIASGSTNGYIHIWKHDSTLLYIINGHLDRVTSLVAQSNNNLISCSGDKTIKIWSAENSYKNIYTLTG